MTQEGGFFEMPRSAPAPAVPPPQLVSFLSDQELDSRRPLFDDQVYGNNTAQQRNSKTPPQPDGAPTMRLYMQRNQGTYRLDNAYEPLLKLLVRELRWWYTEAQQCPNSGLPFMDVWERGDSDCVAAASVRLADLRCVRGIQELSYFAL